MTKERAGLGLDTDDQEDTIERINLSEFQPKQQKDPQKPADKEAVRAISEKNNFPSRQATKKKTSRRRGRPTTGRTDQLNVKCLPQTKERFQKISDTTGMMDCETFERAVELLEREYTQQAG